MCFDNVARILFVFLSLSLSPSRYPSFSDFVSIFNVILLVFSHKYDSTEANVKEGFPKQMYGFDADKYNLHTDNDDSRICAEWDANITTLHKLWVPTVTKIPFF